LLGVPSSANTPVTAPATSSNPVRFDHGPVSPCREYVIEAMIASESYPDLVGTYWKGALTPKAIPSDTRETNKIINFRGISIYRIQNGKMVETWHVSDGLPSKI
jgi:SnoaL-like polyketide cyclase